jgi:hypothetical protein
MQRRTSPAPVTSAGIWLVVAACLVVSAFGLMMRWVLY